MAGFSTGKSAQIWNWDQNKEALMKLRIYALSQEPNLGPILEHRIGTEPLGHPSAH
jgi:hypothetical protein